jgi:hypothetical protein
LNFEVTVSGFDKSGGAFQQEQTGHISSREGALRAPDGFFQRRQNPVAPLNQSRPRLFITNARIGDFTRNLLANGDVPAGSLLQLRFRSKSTSGVPVRSEEFRLHSWTDFKTLSALAVDIEY